VFRIRKIILMKS